MDVVREEQHIKAPEGMAGELASKEVSKQSQEEGAAVVGRIKPHLVEDEQQAGEQDEEEEYEDIDDVLREEGEVVDDDDESAVSGRTEDAMQDALAASEAGAGGGMTEG